MGFVKREKSIVKYSEESISEAIHRKDGKPWEVQYNAKYSMYNSDGRMVATGPLQRAVDDASFKLFVSKEETKNLEGNHLLLVELEHCDINGMSEVIASFDIDFKRRLSKIS